MTDVHSRATRSYNMSRIRSKDTKPEMVVRRFLHGKGFRYRLHDNNLPGKPDIVLPKYKTVIFLGQIAQINLKTSQTKELRWNDLKKMTMTLDIMKNFCTFAYNNTCHASRQISAPGQVFAFY